jgi:hypothetical protein
MQRLLVLALLLFATPAVGQSWVEGGGRSCDDACRAGGQSAVTSGSYRNGQPYFVCATNYANEGPRPGYNLRPYWAKACIVGWGGSEVSGSPYMCLCAGQAASVSPPPAAGRASRHVFRAVKSTSSAAFKHQVEPRLQVDTQSYDRTPYRLAAPWRGVVTVQPGGRVYLAGDAQGTASWTIDNMLLACVENRACAAAGRFEPLSLDGRPVTRLGSNTFEFAAKAIDLTALFTPDSPGELSLLALDYGDVGGMTDVHLIVENGSIR